jgi:eukaryotic-like serine/threonine-protein kinase
MTCPDPDVVLDYLARRLEPTARDALEAHVDTCPPCRELLVELAHTTVFEKLAAPDRERQLEHAPLTDAVDAAAPLPPAPQARYQLGDLIGRGGMGEVRVARDAWIQREVAIKTTRSAADDRARTARFLREARIQGGLEHPAVVPVHDLGVDGDGHAYFVMKRLVGTTLDRLLATAVEAGTLAAQRRMLLGKLEDICLAVEFAHTRRVVHRDIKPSNVMLGDFGEVYLLDWGLARIPASEDTAPPEAGTGDDAPLSTQAGQLLGTPGYMAPEQARGDEAGAAADVYALGCLLFEITTGHPAITPGPDAVAATLEATCHRPSERAPDADIPPEIDDLCARATSADPADRPTAGQLAAGLRAYLDGDRDLARRRELGADHARRAEEALRRHGARGRATAIREAGRALAVDPDNEEAQIVLGRLLLETPDEIPAEALEAADHVRAQTRQQVLRWVGRAYLIVALGLPLLLLFPERDAVPILGLALLNAGTGLLALYLSRRVHPLRTRWYFAALACNTAILGTGCALFGPLFLLPMYLIGSLAMWLTFPLGYPASITVVAHALPLALFTLLEVLGAIPSTFHFDGRSLILTPPALHLAPAHSAILMLLAFTSLWGSTIFIIVSSRRGHEQAQNRIQTHTWHLEQLLPRSPERDATRGGP